MKVKQIQFMVDEVLTNPKATKAQLIECLANVSKALNQLEPEVVEKIVEKVVVKEPEKKKETKVTGWY